MIEPENAPRGILNALVASIVLWLIGGCLCLALLSGCQIRLTPADQLFGDAAKAPKARVHYNPWTKSVDAEVGTDFTGKLDAEYDPTTKKMVIHAEVASNATSVLGQYPGWIGAMEPQRMAEIATLIEREKLRVELHRLVGENMKAAGQMMALAAAGGGEAIAKMTDAVAPILRGSAIDLGTFGGATLGTPPIMGPTP